jgi:hypothetical protein
MGRSRNCELAQTVSVGRSSPEAGSSLLGRTQIMPGAASVNLSLPKLAQTVSDAAFSEGLVFAFDLATPEAQLLVNGMTESQAWYLGWLSDGTQSLELLAAIDCFEEQTWRKNVVALPPVCFMELPKLKAMLEAGIREVNKEMWLEVLCFLL